MNDTICNEENPDRNAKIHPNAKLEQDNNVYYDTYICPHCNLTFSMEVPE